MSDEESGSRWGKLSTYTNYKDWPFWLIVIVIALAIAWYMKWI